MSEAEFSTSIPPSFSSILDAQEIPEANRSPEDFFFYQVERTDSRARAGEWYAIPRVIAIEGHDAFYDLKENGATISQDSRVSRSSRIGAGVLIHEGVNVSDSDIDSHVEIGRGSSVVESTLKAKSFIGPRTAIKSSTLGEGVKIQGGNETYLSSVNRSDIAGGVKIGRLAVMEDVVIKPGVSIGDSFKAVGILGDCFNDLKDGQPYRTLINIDAKIADNVTLGKAVLVGANVTLRSKATVHSASSIGSHTYLGEGATVWKDVTIGRACIIETDTTIYGGKNVKPNMRAFLTDKGQTKVKHKANC